MSRTVRKYRTVGGEGRNRTANLLLARQMLSQLSYNPIKEFGLGRIRTHCVQLPRPMEPRAQETGTTPAEASP